MPDNSEKYRNETYWLTSVLPSVDIAEAYDIEGDILTADELLERWSMFEPYELALAINDEIRCRKHGPHNNFPITYLLCKSRIDPETDRPVHFLRFTYEPFPFTYTWSGDTLSFDFTGIAFKRFHVVNFEHGKPAFLLPRYAHAPKPYNHLAVLREQFPVSGLPQPVAEKPENLCASVPAETPSSGKKDMHKANEARFAKSEARWKEQFSLGVSAAVFCMEQYAKTGKAIEQKQYEDALKELGCGLLMSEADRIFRKTMPQDVLHRGD